MAESGERSGCTLSGTEYCRLLNMRACKNCTMRTAEDLDSVKSDLDVYQSLLPEGGVAQLFLTQECQFCKGEKKGKKSGYAIVDVAHPEPKRIQRRLLGKQVAEFGTMIPLQFAVCDQCRRRFLWMEYAPVLLPVVFGAAGLILLAVRSLRESLAAQAAVLPALLWAALLLCGIVLGQFAEKGAKKRFEKDMRLSAAEHPVLQEMLQNGWKIVPRQSRTGLLFS